MKKFAVLLVLLLTIAFLAGCMQPPAKVSGESTSKEQVTELSEQDENQQLDEFSSTLISEDENIEIGDVV